jgi:glycosyltransferase involved in cell wall biosynthesis
MLHAQCPGEGRVSIVIPVKNGERFITDAVVSALNQGADVREVIVVDDHSTDQTREVLKRTEDIRLRIVLNDGTGVSAARNTGARIAAGDWLLFLDGDDRLCSGAVRKLSALVGSAPEAVVIYGDFDRIDERGQSAGIRRFYRRLQPSGWILERLLIRFLLGNAGTSIVRAQAFRQAGGFNECLRFCEDWHLWCLLAAIGPFRFARGTRVLEYRLHSSNTMNGTSRHYKDFIPAIDAVFSDALIGRRLTGDKRKRLRAAAETHMMSYSGMLAARAGNYRQAASYAWMAATHCPRASPRALARILLAGLWK